MNDDLPLFIDSNFNLIKYVLIIFEKFDLLSPLALDNEEALLLKVNNLNPEYANEFLSCRWDAIFIFLGLYSNDF